ncbi:MAG: TolC family protein, partial [Verrucomicrobiales bacterium]|nr:TolC family protein [Verrucomicrobiales bacterium]
MQRRRKSAATASTAVVVIALYFLSLTSCESLKKRANPADTAAVGMQSAVPEWAQGKLDSPWWRVFDSKSLNADIETALEQSPGLFVIDARLEKAEAKAQLARASTLPRANLGFGYREGREREVDFGPYNLAPWKGTAQFDWELDFFGRLKNLKNSANQKVRAAFFDLEAGEIQLAAAVAATRFRITRLQTEEKLIAESVEANRKIFEIFEDRKKAGIATDTEVLRATAEYENLRRAQLEIERLRKLAEIELAILKGNPGKKQKSHRALLPKIPAPPSKNLDELLASHPELLAAEARVRSAFDLENSTRLNLLPSFKLSGSAFGASPNFLLDQLARWKAEVGPSLDIPIFEPGRIAQLKINRAETQEAAALFREALTETIGEVQSAYINL